MKAARNRIRQHKRRPRLRMESNPAPRSWVRDRFVLQPLSRGFPPIPLTGELVDDMLAFNRGRPAVGADQDAAALLYPRGIIAPAGPPTKAVELHRGPRLRERFRILGWIFRLLRR